ncbi:trigger factor [Candidatus Providencia siddallii]|uniref:Trigger factor n=1 Tax=Candidatus Providencia siddallii TaxID=1715285 RepID=A0ABM9NPD6_9GAMM
MQVSIDVINGLKRSITITIPSLEIKKKINNELLFIAKKVQINGFRKGKAPINIVKQLYKKNITQDVLVNVMQQNFFKIVFEQKIKISNDPSYHLIEFDKNKDLIYSAEFEIFPEIKLKGIEKFEIKKYVISINNEDLSIVLEKLYMNQAKWKNVKKASFCSRITIDYVGYIDDKEFSCNSAKDFVLIIGIGKMLLDFEKSIIGRKVGEKFDIKIKIPKDYHIKDIKGKNIKYSITLKKIEQCDIPNFTEDFIKKFGVTDNSLDSLKFKLRLNIEHELEELIYKSIKKQILSILNKINKFSFSSFLIKQEIDNFLNKNFFINKNKQKIKNFSYKTLEKYIRQNVIDNFIIREIIDKNQLIVDEERVKTLINKNLFKNKDSKKLINNEKNIDNIRNLVLEKQAIESILSIVKINEIKINFDDFINKTNLFD